MIDLNNGGIKGILNRDESVNSEIVRATHPLANLSLTLT